MGVIKLMKMRLVSEMINRCTIIFEKTEETISENLVIDGKIIIILRLK